MTNFFIASLLNNIYESDINYQKDLNSIEYYLKKNEVSL